MTERAPLTRERIAEAALALIDADGLDVLTAASDLLSAEASARYQTAPGR